MFKNIPGFEDYSISKCGLVKSNRRGRLLVQVTRKDGYKELGLRKDKKKYVMLVHRLVAMTYIPNPLRKPCVNHLDSDRGNNNLSNLEWCTYKENLEHASSKGRLIGKRGEDSSSSVMDNSTCHEICKRMEEGATLTELSKCYGINLKTLSNIKNGHRWGEIRSQYNITTKTSKRLTEEDISLILNLHSNGRSVRDISSSVGTTVTTVNKYLKRHQSSTTIPKGSRGKHPEIADSSEEDEDMVWSSTET